MPESVSPPLTAIEQGVVDWFVHFAQSVGLPKSVGEIFGLLFCSPDPLPLDAIVDRLRMSKGSASQGLRFLANINAVHKVYMTGDRRDHFAVELSLRRLVAGFLRERIQPNLDAGGNRLETLHQLVATQAPDDPLWKDRLERMDSWNKQASRLLPLIQTFLDA